MVDVTKTRTTAYGDAAQIIGIITNILLFILSFRLAHTYWGLITFVAVSISLCGFIIELLNDGDGIRSHVGPSTKAVFYAAAAFILLPFLLIPPFIIPLAYATASVLYFTDYRHRAKNRAL